MRPAQTNYYSGIDPRAFGDCRLWVDASDPSTVTLGAGSVVTSVTDKTSNGYVFSNGAGYTYNVTKFNTSYPSFYNTAATSLIGSNTSFAIGRPCTVALVDQITVSTNGTFVPLGNATTPGTTGTLYIQFSNFAGTLYRQQMSSGLLIQSAAASAIGINVCQFNGASSLGFQNGSQILSGNTGPATSMTGCVLGRFSNGSSAFTGHICEVIFYAGLLTTSQRQGLEGYLAWKWGIQSSLVATHPYKTFRPTVRPIIPIEIATPEYWFDAADPFAIVSSGTTLTTLSNKGTARGSNFATASGTITTGSGTTPQNGLNVLGMSSAIGQFTAAFPTQVRTRFFALRPNVNTDTTNVTFMNQTTGTGADTILTQAGQGPSELAQGVAFTMVAQVTPTNQSNIFGAYTLRNASTTASNRIALNGAPGTFSFNAVASGYLTTSSPTQMGSNIEVGEFLSFNSQLSDIQTQLVEGYLAWKWGLGGLLPSTFPFKRGPPMTPLFVPKLLSNCALWLDAADRASFTLSGSSITTWADKSGNARNTTTFGTAPTYATNVVTFNGSQGFSNALSASTNIESGFVVALFTNTTAGNTMLGGVGGATLGARQFRMNNNIQTIKQDVAGVVTTGPNLNANQMYILDYVNDGTTLTHYSNGSTYASGASVAYSAGWTTSIGLRASFVEGVVGSIYEIIVYSRALTLLEREAVEGYLAWKWKLVGALPSGHAYKNVKP